MVAGTEAEWMIDSLSRALILRGLIVDAVAQTRAWQTELEAKLQDLSEDEFDEYVRKSPRWKSAPPPA